jgi:hypothetical protein
MSSPKRAAKALAKTAAKAVAGTAAKTAVKTAAKTARRSVAPRPAEQPKIGLVGGASSDARRLAAAIERGIADGKLDLVDTESLQKLMAAVCRVYTARREAGDQIMPVPKNSISATDVMVTASGLLKAADLAVFELGMWQSWTGR